MLEVSINCTVGVRTETGLGDEVKPAMGFSFTFI